MTPAETADILRQLTEWRQGADVDPPAPLAVDKAIDAAIAMIDRLEAAESDALEQARLNGMGSEREAALLAKLEVAEKERDWNAERLEDAIEECTALRAKIEAMKCMEKQEPSREWWGSLITDISAIDCMHRGDPSYAHDAYWLRERVMQMFEQRRDASPGAQGE